MGNGIREQAATRKERYRLWYEYLKRSRFYALREVKGSKRRWRGCTWKNGQLTDAPEGVDRTGLADFVKRYDHWISCVETLGFDAAYDVLLEDRDCNGAVIDGKEMIHHEVSDILRFFMREKSRRPTLDEFLAEFFRGQLFNEDNVILAMTPMISTEEQLSKGIREHLAAHHKERSARIEAFRAAMHMEPCGKVNEDALKTRLKAYDLQQEGKPVSEIITTIYPGRDPSKKTEDTNMRHMLRRARETIAAVEEGFFPSKPRKPRR